MRPFVIHLLHFKFFAAITWNFETFIMLIECCNVPKFGKCDVTVFQEERMGSVHLSPTKIMLEEKFNTGSAQYKGEGCRLMVLYCIAPDNQRSKLRLYDCKSRATFFAVSCKKSREGNGALERIRTSDLCLRRAALYLIIYWNRLFFSQISYLNYTSDCVTVSNLCQKKKNARHYMFSRLFELSYLWRYQTCLPRTSRRVTTFSKSKFASLQNARRERAPFLPLQLAQTSMQLLSIVKPPLLIGCMWSNWQSSKNNLSSQ